MTKYIKKEYIFIFLSIVGIAFFSLFAYEVYRYRPLVGDDVLMCFTGGLSYYVHPEYSMSEIYLGEIFCSFSEVIDHMLYYYFNWGGRLVTGFFDPLMVMWGRGVSSVISVAIYIAIVLMTMRLAYGSIAESLKHPVMIVGASSLLLLYNNAMDILIMRCMVNLYGFSFLLYLVVFNLYRDMAIERQDKIKQVAIIGLGFLAGVSHELIGAWFLAQFLFYTVVIKKELKSLRFLGGVVVGDIICFFAPGNFARAKRPHDSFSTPFRERIIRSIIMHFKVAFCYEDAGRNVFLFLFIVTVLCIAYLCMIRKKESLTVALEMMVYVMLSVLLWSLVPGVYSRGIYLVSAYVLVAFSSIVFEAEKEMKRTFDVFKALAVVLILIVCIDCLSWIPSMRIQARMREHIIEQAALNSEEEVLVSCFSEECNRRIFNLRDVDSQYELDLFYYTKMYGTHVKLK